MRPERDQLPQAHPRVLVYLIHGTFGNASMWDTKGKQLVGLLRDKFGKDVDIRPFAWAAPNWLSSRVDAASQLANEINQISYQYKNVILIGYSHGGNVALMASNMISEKGKVLISTIATPFMQFLDPELTNMFYRRIFSFNALPIFMLTFGFALFIYLPVIGFLLLSLGLFLRWSEQWFGDSAIIAAVIYGVISSVKSGLWPAAKALFSAVFLLLSLPLLPVIASVRWLFRRASVDDDRKAFMKAIRIARSNEIPKLCIAPRYDEVFAMFGVFKFIAFIVEMLAIIFSTITWIVATFSNISSILCFFIERNTSNLRFERMQNEFRALIWSNPNPTPEQLRAATDRAYAAIQTDWQYCEIVYGFGTFNLFDTFLMAPLYLWRLNDAGAASLTLRFPWEFAIVGLLCLLAFLCRSAILTPTWSFGVRNWWVVTRRIPTIEPVPIPPHSQTRFVFISGVRRTMQTPLLHSSIVTDERIPIIIGKWLDSIIRIRNENGEGDEESRLT